ncbi:MAG: DMT family transporter [Anaerolineales bacterium]|nr:DMT family transporter [Anaerolineales bacterium]
MRSLKTTFSVLQPQTPRIQADLALLSTAIIWGSAFVAQRTAAEQNPYLFNGLRFLLAGMALLPALFFTPQSRESIRKLDHQAWSSLVLAGLILAGGAAFQQAGLRYTTAGNAGFITGLYVILVPIFQTLTLRQPTRRIVWLSAGLAAIGLFLLSTGGKMRINPGDTLELAGALFWAFHVIWIGRLVTRLDGLQIAVGQFLVCGLASCGVGLLADPGALSQVGRATWAIVYAGLISGGLGYTLQIFGQKLAPPSDAAILLSMEAVFAALFGALFLKEILNLTQLAGCAIMLTGMLLAQTNAWRKEESLQAETKPGNEILTSSDPLE